MLEEIQGNTLQICNEGKKMKQSFIIRNIIIPDIFISISPIKLCRNDLIQSITDYSYSNS